MELKIHFQIIISIKIVYMAQFLGFLFQILVRHFFVWEIFVLIADWTALEYSNPYTYSITNKGLTRSKAASLIKTMLVSGHFGYQSFQCLSLQRAAILATAHFQFPPQLLAILVPGHLSEQLFQPPVILKFSRIDRPFQHPVI